MEQVLQTKTEIKQFRRSFASEMEINEARYGLNRAQKEKAWQAALECTFEHLGARDAYYFDRKKLTVTLTTTWVDAIAEAKRWNVYSTISAESFERTVDAVVYIVRKQFLIQYRAATKMIANGVESLGCDHPSHHLGIVCEISEEPLYEVTD